VDVGGRLRRGQAPNVAGGEARTWLRDEEAISREPLSVDLRDNHRRSGWTSTDTRGQLGPAQSLDRGWSRPSFVCLIRKASRDGTADLPLSACR
jgi:hypothetical protein